MDTYSTMIKPGYNAQFAVGDARKDAFVKGTATVVRGSLRATWELTIDAEGSYSSSYIGPATGNTLKGSRVGNKLLIKILADTSDSLNSSFKMTLEKVKHT